MANLITPTGRLSYPSLFKPRPNELNPEAAPKYEATLLFPKDLSIAVIKNAIKDAIAKEYPSGKLPNGFKGDIIKDGDDEKYAEKDGYPGHWVVCFKSKYPPAVVSSEKLGNGNWRPITEDSREIYGGAWCRVAFRAYCYDVKNNKGTSMSRGVSLDLASIQKLRDDEPFGNGPSNPNDDFDDAGVAAVAGGIDLSDFE